MGQRDNDGYQRRHCPRQQDKIPTRQEIAPTGDRSLTQLSSNASAFQIAYQRVHYYRETIGRYRPCAYTCTTPVADIVSLVGLDNELALSTFTQKG